MPLSMEQNGVARGPLKPTRDGLVSQELDNFRHYSSPYTEASSSRASSYASAHSAEQSTSASGPSNTSRTYADAGLTYKSFPQIPASQPQVSRASTVYQPLGLSSQTYDRPPIVPSQRQITSYINNNQDRRSPAAILPPKHAPASYNSPYTNGAPPRSESGHGHDFTYSQNGTQQSHQYPQSQPRTTSYQQAGPSMRMPQRSTLQSQTLPTHPNFAKPVSVPPHAFYTQRPQPLTQSAESSVYPLSSPSPGPSSSSTPARKRIGRPPGSKNIKKHQPSTLSSEIQPSPKRRPGRPARSTLANAPVYANPNIRPDGSIKKRGRPFKSAESAVLAISKVNGTYIPKKRGRPMKTHDHIDVAVPLTEYVPFICEWQGCKAELHNLETLVRHVIAVHAKKVAGNEAMTCSWGRCAGNVPHDSVEESILDSPVPEEQPKIFASRNDLHEHIGKVHVLPFSWHVGDGPKATSLDPRPETHELWLNDENGNQVTPSVTNQEIEFGIAKKNRVRWWKEVGQFETDSDVDNTGEAGDFMKTKAQLDEEGLETETGTPVDSGGEVETGNDLEDITAEMQLNADMENVEMDVSSPDDEINEDGGAGMDAVMENGDVGHPYSIESDEDEDEDELSTDLMVLDRL